MTRTVFEKEINLLNQEVKEMGELVENAISDCMKAFQNQDMKLAKTIVSGDRRVNDIEKSIESRCLSLVLKQQPVVAKDLRTVSSALKVVTDMERIGDHAADIAELILRFQDEHVYGIVKDIPHLAEEAQKMVHDAVKAFVQHDEEAAHIIIKQDDVVDDLFNGVKEEIIDLLKTDSANPDICVDLIMIAKYLERIGDHAVNICEWTEFNVTGSVQNVKLV